MIITNGKLISIDTTDIINGTFRNDDIIEVGNNCFKDLPTLNAVVLNNAIKIEQDNFMYCFNLKLISLPKVIDIDKDCIHYCENLNSINIPNVINIGNDCFWGCHKLTNVLLPQVLNIGFHCFYDCMTLTRLVLPFETIPLLEGEYCPFIIKQERLTEQFLILTGGVLSEYQEGIILNTNRSHIVIQDGKRGYGNNLKKSLKSLYK